MIWPLKQAIAYLGPPKFSAMVDLMVSSTAAMMREMGYELKSRTLWRCPFK